MKKADYGKVPNYLQDNKDKIAQEKARVDALLLAAEQVCLCPRRKCSLCPAASSSTADRLNCDC